MQTCFQNVKNKNNWEYIIIAYEPIWENEMNTSITKEQVEEMHEYIRNEISKKVGEDIGNKIRIMWGENIDENNCNELIVLKNVDGFLVGRISKKILLII